MTYQDSWWNGLGIPESHRPWGHYEVLLDSDDVKVKRITVNPNSRLSYQYHDKRREQWTVVKGNLTIVLDDDKVFRYLKHKKLKLKYKNYNSY